MVLRTSAFFLLAAGALLPQVPPSPPKPQPAAKSTTPVPTGEWPHTIAGGKAVFTVHQPQIDSWDGIRAQGLCAVAAKLTGQDNPSYGVLHFSARTLVDRPARIVSFDDYKVEKIDFPATPDRAPELAAALKTGPASVVKTLSLDRFEAALAAIDAHKRAETVKIKNDPPKIIFQVVPSMLIYVDGNPVFRPVAKTSFERVINARPLIVKDSSGKLYLHVFDGWMESTSLTGDWSLAGHKPRELDQILATARKNAQIDLLEGQPDPDTKKKPHLEKGKIPQVVVATTPTEMIVSDGEWQWAQVPPAQLEYVSNTTGHIFRQKQEQKIYVLVSGRWFRAADRQGPWEFVPGGQLSDDFRNIPDDSPKENVKASIPDTPQAGEAVIAAMIPQTAVVNKKQAKLTKPIFDGEPELKPIEGTKLEYVANSPTPIIKTGMSLYYAVENGVWFNSTSLEGPWAVADTVPAEIYAIPASSPLYYVAYVKVFSATPDTVTFGYTPGYFGSVITSGSGAVVVYGTGWYYPPWVGPFYWYGPPVTYGFGTAVTYTPWTGWAFGYGFGWSYGWGAVTVGWGWGCYPWWGPAGWAWYYPPIYAGGAAWGPAGAMAWGPYGGWAGTTGNIYGRWGNTAYVNRQSGGYNPWTGNRWSNKVGMSYNSRTGTLAAGQRAAVGNVYTGNYAYGARGAATNLPSGASISGGRATVGNIATGNQATINRGQVTGPGGQSTNFGGIRGDQGAIGHVGDNVFGAKDGNVYRHTDNGWEQINNGAWNRAQNSERTQNLNRERDFRLQGQGRWEGFHGGPAYSGGGFRGGGFRSGGFRRR